VSVLASPTGHQAGLAFYYRIKPAVIEIAEARLEATDRRAKPRGLLRLSAPTAFGKSFVIPAISKFQKEFPEIEIDLAVSDRPVDIVAEGLDLAIRVRHLPDSSLKARRLGDIRIVVYAATEYFDRHGRPEYPKDLKHHRCLLREGLEETWPFQVDGRAVSVQVQGHLKINEVHAMNAAVAHGLGVHQGPYWHVSEQFERREFEVVLDNFEPPRIPIYAAYPPSRLTPAKTRLFLDALTEELQRKGFST